jgi:hypothetical protein
VQAYALFMTDRVSIEEIAGRNGMKVDKVCRG